MSTRNVRTLGIVLSRRNFAEADRILDLYTEKLGKISAMAKGARKLTSRKSSHLEPGNIIDFELAQGKTFFVVTGARTVKYHRFEDLKSMQKLFIWLEVLNHVFHPGEPNKKLFELTVNGISAAEQSNNNPSKVILSELELYSTIGFQLHLDKCVVGLEVLKESENYLSIRLGGILCPLHKDKGPDGLQISVSAIKVLRLIQSKRFSILEKLSYSRGLILELEKVATLQRHEIIEKRLKSESF